MKLYEIFLEDDDAALDYHDDLDVEEKKLEVRDFLEAKVVTDCSASAEAVADVQAVHVQVLEVQSVVPTSGGSYKSCNL